MKKRKDNPGEDAEIMMMMMMMMMMTTTTTTLQIESRKKHDKKQQQQNRSLQNILWLSLARSLSFHFGTRR